MMDRIGNCRVLEEVAAGGMAVVYKAIQDNLNRTVAIKALKSSVAGDEHLSTRFEREATSLANLQHENIIHVYDFYRDGESLFIVMEYVRGIDVYDLLDKCGRVPFDVGAIVSLQVARALDYIHYRGIIHRDIKPANIMLSRQGSVKLMDFGIARDQNYAKDLTVTGTGIGTPSYMSPEQILGDKLDARSDIFSLGIVMFQMVTGRKPFVETEDKSVLHLIREEKHPRIRKLNTDVPRELERIIDKCLQKKPRDRFQSAQALVMALERFLSKHVDMNYHSRLVLYLRNQDVITSLEAEEYLGPQNGQGGKVLDPARLAHKNTLKRMALLQGGVMAVLGLFTGIIHLAPVGATVPSVVEREVKRGYVRFVVNPWGKILVDGEERGVTPLANPIDIPEGQHQITIEHATLPPNRQDIFVVAGTPEEAREIFVDLDKGSDAEPKLDENPDTKPEGSVKDGNEK